MISVVILWMFILRAFGPVGIRVVTPNIKIRLINGLVKLIISSTPSGVVTVMRDALRKILNPWSRKSMLGRALRKKEKLIRVVPAAKFGCQKTEIGRRAIWQISLIGI